MIEHDLGESYFILSLFGTMVEVNLEVVAKVLGILLVDVPSMSDLEVTIELDEVSIDL